MRASARILPRDPSSGGDRDDSTGKIGRKINMLLLLAVVTFLSIARHIKPTSSQEQQRKRKRKQKQKQNVTTGSLPIYLLHAATNKSAQTTWGTLAKQWNRTTQYDDLLDIATSIPSLPANTYTSLFERSLVMIHCGPKMGSTTLRQACKTNLKKTCGVVNKKVSPVGYMNKTALYPLMRKCTNTTHFCAKEMVMPYEVPTFNNTFFIHMFPFRNYDEWAISALKQRYDRGHERECNKTKAELEECIPSTMEIDFRKYGKTQLSNFKEGVVKRMNDKNEHHVFVLYHHRELNDILQKMSDLYDVPLLPGSNGKGKAKRPKGTCNQEIEILGMFHDCFSSELMELK